MTERGIMEKQRTEIRINLKQGHDNALDNPGKTATDSHGFSRIFLFQPFWH